MQKQKPSFWVGGLSVPDGVLDENDKGEKRVRHVTVNVEGRHILRKHEDVRLVRLLEVGLHPLIIVQKNITFAGEAGQTGVWAGEPDGDISKVFVRWWP